MLIPPPKLELVFPDMVELEIVREVPILKIPAPLTAEFPDMVELEIARVPELLKAPPLPFKLAPETVTPAIERLPPVLMLKMLKLPLLPLMLRVFAPGPVMVRVPAVEASAIAGSGLEREILADPLVNRDEAKTMVSFSG